MVLFGVTLVSITAVLMGALSYTRARTALESEARARLSLMAHDVAERLHMELEDRAADITNWSRLEVMSALRYRDVDKQLAEFVRQILQGRGIYRAIFCATPDGAPVAGAGEIDLVQWHSIPAAPHLFIVPSRDPAAGLLQIETAVFDPQHPTSTMGALLVLLDPQAMLENVTRSVEHGGVPASLLLRERGGKVVFSTAATVPEPRQILAGTAIVGPASGLDAPNLEVSVFEPRATALAAVTALRRRLAELAALVLVFGAGLGAIVAWRISQPIRHLTDTVQQISERGQLQTDVEFPRIGGEIGVLATSFRTMMTSLAAAQHEAFVKSRLALLGEIAANIAHDVRTPLSVLKVSAQLLSRGELPVAEQRELALRLAAEVDRLNRVVTNFVDLARPAPVRYGREDVAEIVARAAAFFGPLAAELGIEIVRRNDDGSLHIQGSRDQLYQVFLNIMHNGLHAMGKAGTLSVRSTRDGAWVHVDFEDTGPGFPGDVLPHVFSPFFTTKSNGTGLGLAIAKRIVEEHGGTIFAENLAAGGAKISIRLPRKDLT